MKKNKLFSVVLLLATIFLGFTACSDDDDNGNSSDLSKSLIGTWEITAWESDEGKPNEGIIGFQFIFNVNGAVSLNDTTVGTWHVTKRGDTMKYECYRNITLQYETIVLEERVGDECPLVFLIKARTKDTMFVSILDFELENDPNVYSRGTLKKIK